MPCASLRNARTYRDGIPRRLRPPVDRAFNHFRARRCSRDKSADVGEDRYRHVREIAIDKLSYRRQIINPGSKNILISGYNSEILNFSISSIESNQYSISVKQDKILNENAGKN